MSSKILRRIISISMALVMVFVFAACSNDKQGEDGTQADSQNATTVQANAGAVETTTEAETTTVPETTTVEETTLVSPAVQKIVDTLSGKKFYLAGTMNLTGGDKVDTKMTCDGDNYRLEMNSSQMNLSMCYLDGNPYIINNSKNQYVLFDEAAVNSLDKVLSSFSSLGVSLSGADMDEMKGMMSDFDQNMDFSQYINEGDFFEYQQVIEEETYICSKYSTEYGAIIIYTLGETLKFIDVYDAEGLRQMRMEVTAFIPQVLTPISLTGLTKAPSILHLFGLA